MDCKLDRLSAKVLAIAFLVIFPSVNWVSPAAAQHNFDCQAVKDTYLGESLMIATAFWTAIGARDEVILDPFSAYRWLTAPLEACYDNEYAVSMVQFFVRYMPDITQDLEQMLDDVSDSMEWPGQITHSWSGETDGMGENIDLAADGPIVLEPGIHYFHVEKDNPRQSHVFLDTRVEPDFCMISRSAPPFRRQIQTTCKVWMNMTVVGAGQWTLKIKHEQ